VAGTVVELGSVEATVVLTAVVVVSDADVDVELPASEPPHANVVNESTPARTAIRAKLTGRRYRSDVSESGQP
jgi:hypothetical protein